MKTTKPKLRFATEGVVSCLLPLTFAGLALAAIPPDPTPESELTGHDFIALDERCAKAHETVDTVEEAVKVSRECGELDGFIVGLLGGAMLEMLDHNGSNEGDQPRIAYYCLSPDTSVDTALAEASKGVRKAEDKNRNAALIVLAHFKSVYPCE